MKNIVLLLILTSFLSCNSKAQEKKQETGSYPITKTESEWKTILSTEQFYVLREAGTERAFTSPLNKNYEKGSYICAACKTPLFKSENKFDSGTGWPSFDTAIKDHVAYTTDYNIGYARTEEHCANCSGHLGHVFNDGPKETTGKRHCINGAALEFIAASTEK